MSVHERNIAELVDSMAELLAAPPLPTKRSIGFVTHDDKPKGNTKVVKAIKVGQRRKT